MVESKPEPYTAYYEYYQIPLFFFLVFILWGVIAIRLHVFITRSFRNCGWRSYRGVSMALILFSGLCCTAYFGLIIAIFMLNRRVASYVEVTAAGSSTHRYMDFSRVSREDLKEVHGYAATDAKVIYAARMILITSLWTTKAAFVVIFLEVASKLSKLTRGFLYFTAAYVALSAVLAWWTVGKDIVRRMWPGILRPAKDLVDIIGGCPSMRYLRFEWDVEFLHSAMNITTDLCLIFIAYKIVRSFPVARTAVLLPTIMVLMTLCIAISRLGILITMHQSPEYAPYVIIPFQVLSEFEAFLSVIIACFPGLRVFFWRKDKNQLSRGSPPRDEERAEIQQSTVEITPPSPVLTEPLNLQQIDDIVLAVPGGGEGSSSGGASSPSSGEGEKPRQVYMNEDEGFVKGLVRRLRAIFGGFGFGRRNSEQTLVGKNELSHVSSLTNKIQKGR